MTEPAPIRILLVDDQTLFREGLRKIVAAQPGLDVVGEAADGEAALRLADTLRPAVVLMDLRMPVLDGVAATRRLRAALPECQVIVLTTFDDDEYVFDGLRAGAIGYLLKDAPSDKLIEAIHAAARGESVLQPSVAAKVVARFTQLVEPTPPNPLADPLSPRELDILRLLDEDLSIREIAERLVVSVNTIKTQIKSAYAKLDAHSRDEALAKAHALKLL